MHVSHLSVCIEEDANGVRESSCTEPHKGHWGGLIQPWKNEDSTPAQDQVSNHMQVVKFIKEEDFQQHGNRNDDPLTNKEDDSKWPVYRQQQCWGEGTTNQDINEHVVKAFKHDFDFCVWSHRMIKRAHQIE